MRRHCVLVCVLWAALLVAPGAMADEDELLDWAHARWEAYLSDSPEVLAEALHPDGGTVFMGTPWDGFHYGEDSHEAWSSLQEWLAPEHLEVLEEHVLPNGNLVWAQLILTGRAGEEDDPPEISVASALVFDSDGRIVAEDFIVLDGLESDSPAPVWDEPLDPEAYTHHLQENRTGMELWWRNGLAVLLAGVRAPGTGWAAVGFDPERRMQGADFVIGAVTNGELDIEDHHGHLPTGHRKDDHQDILAAGGEISDGEVTLQFVIPLHSGDPDDNTLVPGESYAVILAYHNTSTSLTARHTARASDSITLEE